MEERPSDSAICKEQILDFNKDIVSFLFNVAKCCKCQKIPLNPLTKCKNDIAVFCSDCIKKEADYQQISQSIEPLSSIILNQLKENFAFHCVKRDQGCNFTINFEKADELFRHESECDYSFVECINNKCGVKVLKKDLNDHLNVCEFKPKITNQIDKLIIGTLEEKIKKFENVTQLQKEEISFLNDKFVFLEKQQETMINCFENSFFYKEKFQSNKNEFYMALIELKSVFLKNTINRYGENSREAAMEHLSLGIFYYKVTVYEVALNHLNKSLEIIKSLEDETSKLLYSPLFHIGMSHFYNFSEKKIRANEKPQEESLNIALDFINQALNIAELNNMENEKGECYNGKGLIYEELNDCESAKACHQMALEIKRSLIKEVEDRVLGEYYNNLGLVMNTLGKFEESIGCHKKALEIFRKTIGYNNYEIGNTNFNIGQAYYSNHLYEKALKYFKATVKIYKSIVLKDISDLGMCYHKIGMIFFNKKMFKKSLKFLKLSKKNFRRKDIITKIENFLHLGVCYYNLGKHLKSKSYFGFVDSFLQRNDELEVLKKVEFYETLSNFHLDVEDYLGTLTYLGKAEELVINSKGENHPDLYHIFYNFGVAYHGMEKHERALLYYSKSLEIANFNKLDEIDVANAHYEIGIQQSKLKEYKKAIANFEFCKEIYEKAMGPRHKEIANFYYEIGVAEINSGQTEKGVSSLRKSAEIYEENGTNLNFDSIKVCYLQIIDAYNLDRMYDKAKEAITEITTKYQNHIQLNSKFDEELKIRKRRIYQNSYKNKKLKLDSDFN